MLSTDSLTIAVAQLNPTVGDIAGNSAKLAAARAGARADLVIATEHYLAGGPAEDLTTEPAFLDAIERAVGELARQTEGGPGLLIGAPWRHEGAVYDAALLLDRGALRAVRFKHALGPDETRWFAAGPAPGPMAFRGIRLGVMLGQDMATPDAAETLQESGAQLLIVLDCAPFVADGRDEFLQQAVARVQESGLALLRANPVGGQDELVFDGGSFALDGQCRLRFQAPCWREAIVATDWQLEDDERWSIAAGPMTPPEEGPAALWQALGLGLRDYVVKNGWPGTTIDGPDALLQALAVEALGVDRVQTVGGLPLSAADKTGLALGAASVNGLFAPFKDLYATDVAALARWRGLDRPRAEAAARDEILRCLIDRGMTIPAVVARGHAPDTVKQVWQMVNRAEYKRRQAPPGIKTSRRTFGRERRYPITNSFQGG